jgi:hypothetical protein
MDSLAPHKAYIMMANLKVWLSLSRWLSLFIPVVWLSYRKIDIAGNLTNDGQIVYPPNQQQRQRRRNLQEDQQRDLATAAPIIGNTFEGIRQIYGVYPSDVNGKYRWFMLLHAFLN